jgi:hypothetical protein
MASPALLLSYLFLVLVAVVVVVLCCLGCGCHVPLGKCVRCFCSNTTQCSRKLCPRKKGEGEGEFGSVLDQEAGAKPNRKTAAEKGADEPGCGAGCAKWVPMILTCGYCFGACKEGRTTPSRGSTATVVGQPVNTASSAGGMAPIDVDEVMGTDYVVAVKMPLLSMN